MSFSLQFKVYSTYSELWQYKIILICRPKYNIAIMSIAFEPVKQFFLSDSFGFELMTESFFGHLLLDLQLFLATAELP